MTATLTASATAPAECLLLTIPVGPDREPAVIHPVRTVEQRATVRNIVGQPEFDSACGNPFEPDVHYTGPMSFMWYDLDQRLHATRIAPDGEIVRHRIGTVTAN